MSQDLVNSGDSLSGGDGGKITVSGATGTICPKTGLYKATDNKTVFIELIEANQPFPNYPGGNGRGKTTWTSLSVSEGSNDGFDSVLATAGSA